MTAAATVGSDTRVRDAARQTGDASEEELRKQEEFHEEAIPHLDAVYRFALRLTSSEAEAEDLVQETYIRAYRSWDQYTLGTNCRSWLFTICRNRFVRKGRRRARHDELLRENSPTHRIYPLQRDPAFSESRDEDPEGGFFERIVDDTILEAIDGLPPQYREAVQLSDLEGMRYQEVADVLDVPVGTVKSRLFRGRRLLQEKLHDYAVSMGYLRPEGTEDPEGTGNERSLDVREPGAHPAATARGVRLARPVLDAAAS